MSHYSDAEDSIKRIEEELGVRKRKTWDPDNKSITSEIKVSAIRCDDARSGTFRTVKSNETPTRWVVGKCLCVLIFLISDCSEMIVWLVFNNGNKSFNCRGRSGKLSAFVLKVLTSEIFNYSGFVLGRYLRRKIMKRVRSRCDCLGGRCEGCGLKFVWFWRIRASSLQMMIK